MKVLLQNNEKWSTSNSPKADALACDPTFQFIQALAAGGTTLCRHTQFWRPLREAQGDKQSHKWLIYYTVLLQLLNGLGEWNAAHSAELYVPSG